MRESWQSNTPTLQHHNHMKTETTARRPFHETIVEAIQGASSHDLPALAKLIKMTVIPTNHDEIIAAWRWAAREHCCQTPGVPASLLEQKQEAEEKAAKKAKEKEQAVAAS